jgi:cbb3-type cytochrome oxidase subunit 3
MNALFAAHSGLRYLVLLAGLVAVVYFALGLAQKRPYTRAVRTVGAIFSGLMDLQILLGLILVLMGRYYPQLIGHIVLMVLAAVVVHVLLAKNRKRAQPGYALPLAGVVLGLVLLAAGILAIRPSIFFMTRL